MGVVNVTPDSFSDGGRFLDADGRDRARPRAGGGGRGDPRRRRRVDPARRRPGRRPTRSCGACSRSCARSPPTPGVPVSIDTTKAAVAAAALDAGAAMVNDVSGGTADPEMLPRRRRRAARRSSRCTCAGTPRTMQHEAQLRRRRARGRRRAARARRRGGRGRRRRARDPRRSRHRLREERRAQPRAARARCPSSRRASGFRCSSARRASRSSAACSATRRSTRATTRRWRRRSGASSTAPRWCACTTSPRSRRAVELLDVDGTRNAEGMAA